MEAGMSTASKPTIKLPFIIDNVNFKFESSSKTEKGHKVIATCLHCPEGKLVSGCISSSGNFLPHLKRVHGDKYDDYQKKRLKLDPKQPSLQHMVKSVTKGAQIHLDKLVVNYIVNSMKPLSTVEDPNFIALIKGLCPEKDLKLMSRYNVDNQIRQLYSETIESLKAELSTPDYVCLTADCWSTHSQSFLGVTVHWINEKFHRESRTLSCKRFKGVHSYDRIAESLNEVMNTYSLSLEKVVSIVTDNGSNFCKAFREFSKEYNDDDNEEGDEDDSDGDRIPVFDVPIPRVDSEYFEFVETEPDEEQEDLYHEAIYDDLNSHDFIALPPHFRCMSHSLSLIATKDIKKSKSKKLYQKIMQKCSKLWVLSHSSKSAEIITEVCGKALVRPVPTRWNSLYDAVKRLLDIKSHLAAICAKLSIPSFSTKELEFLETFAKVSDPIAAALDKMQGEKFLYMGAVLPTLIQLDKKLELLKGNVPNCESIRQALLAGVRRRFEKHLRVDTSCPSDLLMGAVSNPFFKLRWLLKSQQDDVKRCFINQASTFFDMSKVTKLVNTEESDSFFDFDNTPSADDSNSDLVEMECQNYFNDDSKDIGMLAKYPTVMKIFLRYNTGLPSSAPVERLFSYGGLILTSRRCRLKDQKFEQLVVIKTNRVFASRNQK